MRFKIVSELPWHVIPESESDRAVTDGGIDLVTEYDPDDHLTREVVRSVASVKGVDETDLEPLYEHVEIDALETMIRHADERDRDVTVAFAFDGITVRVHSDGVIRIADGSQ